MRNDGTSTREFEEEPRVQSRDVGFISTWNTTRLHISAMTQGIDWPWSGSVRKTFYVDVFIYLVLLVMFCCVTLIPTTTTSIDAYKLVNSIQSTLLQENRPEPEISFFNINELAGLQRWLEGPFMAVFFGYNPNSPDQDVFTNMTPLPTYIPGFYLASTTVLGPIRLRQLRVRSDSCKVRDRWQDLVKTCFAGYNTRGAKVQDGDDFGRMWYAYDNSTQVEAVINKTLSDADEFPPTAEQVHARKIIMDGFQFDNHTKAGIYRGRLSNLYEAQGFVLDIPEYNEAEAREVLRFLRATNWLDAQTRALFMEFSLYLPPSNILLSARLVMEVHETGTIWTDISLEPINLGIFRSDSPAEVGLLVVSLVLVFGAMVWDLQSTWKLRRYHVKQTSSAYVWVFVGILLYLTIIAAAILHIMNMIRVKNLEFKFAEYFPSHRLGYLVTVERGLLSMASFVIWFRLLKFTSQLPRLGILGRTIGRALPQVAAFFMISCVIFAAFAQCFFMAYYATVPGYQSIQGSLMSVLRFTVLDFDYAALSQENRILTPFLFSLLLLIVFFVWVNVMVAIISEVYQQECDNALRVEWDEDFEAMSADIPQPQNDLAAMRLHYPVVSTDREKPPEPVALTPDRFFRLRIEKLERFEDMVTVDMLAHFTALAEAQPLHAGLQGNTAAVHAYGLPRFRPSAFMSGKSKDSAIGTWTKRGGHGRVFTPGEDMNSGAEGLRQPAARGAADTAPSSASSSSLSDDDDDGETGIFPESMLEQHRGVYARLGTYSRLKNIRKSLLGGHGGGGSGMRDVDSELGGKSDKTRPMELQAVYFDRTYHNETTARMWWDDHKSFFDTREQLIKYALVSGQRTLKKVASKLRRTRPGAPSAHNTPRPRTEHSPAAQDYASAAAAAAYVRPDAEASAADIYLSSMSQGPPGGMSGETSGENASYMNEPGMHGDRYSEHADRVSMQARETGSGLRSTEGWNVHAYVHEAGDDADISFGVAGNQPRPPSRPLI